jgi:26S proteasome non-ATPase regulatory subunit 9
MDIIDLTPEPKEDWDLPKLQNLIKEKDEMEQEIRRITAELTGPGGPGLEGGLVDKDGFPIADYYKVVDVREKRGKLASSF